MQKNIIYISTRYSEFSLLNPKERSRFLVILRLSATSTNKYQPSLPQLSMPCYNLQQRSSSSTVGVTVDSCRCGWKEFTQSAKQLQLGQQGDQQQGYRMHTRMEGGHKVVVSRAFCLVTYLHVEKKSCVTGYMCHYKILSFHFFRWTCCIFVLHYIQLTMIPLFSPSRGLARKIIEEQTNDTQSPRRKIRVKVHDYGMGGKKWQSRVSE